ncbi:unnamed protein product [Mytilus coruscus]|uniref:Uncharacterized protein n=1 Tax=Mytilus coruscus TaxID=42192 RepID=A0A6J8A0C9_MYTCO|nr:unnamed protein product [Mytilus coruscus]
MHDKAASTTLDMFANILDDISDICETYRNNDITSHGHSILSNIRNFMSDRAQTNIAFTELLQNYRTEIMPTFLQNWNELTIGEQTSTVKVNNFFCGLHLLVNFAECLSPILLQFERMQEKETVIPETSDDEDRPDIQIYAFDAKTISFLRFCGKCFGRGVDEKSGCYSAFKTYCQRENENVMFVDFRGNRFNIIFLMGQIAFYQHERIKAFFEIVHGANNKLHKLTLQLVKKQYILACCKVLGLISKLITAPLWRLIESNMHVLDMNTNYLSLLTYLDRMSKDSTDFITGEEFPFPRELVEKDKMLEKLVQANEGIDDKACAFAQLAFRGLHQVLAKAMKEQLPGGAYFSHTEYIRDQTKSVIPHNKIPERVFGILDFFLRYRPNASTICNDAFLMFVFNKTSDWLEALPVDERNRMLEDSIKEGRQIRTKYQERLKEIENKRKEKLREKQIALERKQKAAIKTKTKHTSDVIYYGLWQRPDEVDDILNEITSVTEKRKALISQIRFRQKVLKQVVVDKKLYFVSEKGKALSLEKLKSNVIKLIVDATEGPSEERVARDVPLFVGKKVLHTFKEGKWNGRVLSVVKGFPEFYNIVYDCDLDESTATISSATAIYTYKRKQEYRDGNLEILPEAVR